VDDWGPFHGQAPDTPFLHPSCTPFSTAHKEVSGCETPHIPAVKSFKVPLKSGSPWDSLWIFLQACMTVVWSRPPKARPIWVRVAPTRSRAIYMLT